MGKSTAIGTAHTTAVIKFLKAHGFGNAELRNLAGAFDKGDITGTPGIAWECKGGKAAESASDLQVAQWLAETERERINADADIGVLVMKRKGIGVTNAGRYWAAVPLWAVRTYPSLPNSAVAFDMVKSAPVKMHLADAVMLLRACGYGDPL